MPCGDAAHCPEGASEVLSSPDDALVLEEDNHELEVLCLDGEPAEGSVDIFLENSELYAV